MVVQVAQILDALAVQPLRLVDDQLTSAGGTVVGVDQRQHSVGPHSRTADLTDEDQVRKLFAGVKNDLGRIDVLYNNAGLNDREDHSVSPNSRPMSALGARRNTSALLARAKGGPSPPVNDMLVPG
jgi:NAD(P)-dependent dehydrogenase (short-subunit alcohol dehydrogenase family)